MSPGSDGSRWPPAGTGRGAGVASSSSGSSNLGHRAAPMLEQEQASQADHDRPGIDESGIGPKLPQDDTRQAETPRRGAKPPTTRP